MEQFLPPSDGSVFRLAYDLMEKKIMDTLGGLVHRHINHEITPQDALSGIALIAGLRGVQGDLIRKMKV